MGDRIERLVARSTSAHGCVAQLEELATRPGSLVLTGEVGTGRTTLATYFLALAGFRTRAPTTIDGQSPNAEERLREQIASARASERNGAVIIDRVHDGLASDTSYLLDLVERNGGRVVLITDELDAARIPQRVPRVHVPPLRARRSDVAQLARQLALRSCAALSHRRVGISSAAMDALESYRWPENVRELANVVDRAISLRHDLELIDVDDLPRRVRPVPAADDEDLSLDTARRHHVERVLALHRGNATAAAESLGVSRNSVARWLAKWDEAPEA